MPATARSHRAAAVALLAGAVLLVVLLLKEPPERAPAPARAPAPVLPPTPTAPADTVVLTARLVREGRSIGHEQPEPGASFAVFATAPPPSRGSPPPSSLASLTGAPRIAAAAALLSSAPAWTELGGGRSDDDGKVRLAVSRAALTGDVLLGVFVERDGEPSRGASWSPPAFEPHATAIDLGDVALQPLVRVRVVVTAGGHPVAGALAVTDPTTSRSNERRATNGPTDAGTTDAGGVVSLLAEESTRLHVSAPGLADRTLRLHAPGRDGVVHAVVALEPGATIGGKIVDGDGRPVAGESIRVSVDAEREDVERRSDAGGAFVFEGLVAGQRYDLIVGRRDHVSAVAGCPEMVVNLGAPGALVARATGDVDFEAAVLWYLEKQDEDGGWEACDRVSGRPERTFEPLLPGTYRLAASDRRRHFAVSPPVEVRPGAKASLEIPFTTRRIEAVLAGARTAAANGFVVVVDEGDRFALDHLFDGGPAAKFVDGRLSIPAPTGPFRLHVRGRGCLDAEVPVPAGTEPASVSVSLRPGRAVRVVLKDESGRSMAGKVAWQELDGATPASGEKNVDDIGSEVVVSPSRVALVATARRQGFAPARVELAAAAEPTAVTLTCDPLRPVRVTPKLPDGSEPAGRAWLTWRTADGRTDIKRLFDEPPWVIPAPPEDVTIEVRAWGFLATEVSVAAGRDADVTVPLEPGVGFESQLVDARGRRVRNGTVVITTPGAHDVNVSVDADWGKFGWGLWLPPGDWQVRAAAPGYRERVLTVRKGEPFPATIVLTRR